MEYVEKSLEQGCYEWACFAAHQSAEKAVKAIFFKLSAAAWSHSVGALL
ncbi:MAG: HEPN domain-containing protein [Anaerolineae bacterium]|nr:HEPN domain-containing protein [Anaerolineae bacterium]